MKYQNLKSFQKHLSSAAPHNLCSLYLALVKDDFERGKVMDKISSFFPDPPNYLSCSQAVLRDCLDALRSISLFGESLTILDEVEKLSKADLMVLLEHLKETTGYVILGSRSKVESLASFVEKEGVVFDLLDEKPWDKEKRVVDLIVEQLQNADKKLAPGGSDLLLERVGLDWALLTTEVDKLICYLGDRSTVSLQDIVNLCPVSKTATLWQTAEEVIWEGEEFGSFDSSSFHGMIPALRGQLHLGLCLATLIEEKRPSSEWGQFLPKLWPKTLEKRSSQAARLGSTYFRKGLERLLDIEILSRSDSTQYMALICLFKAHLAYAR